MPHRTKCQQKTIHLKCFIGTQENFLLAPILWVYNYNKALTLLTIYFASLPTPRKVAEEKDRCPGNPT